MIEPDDQHDARRVRDAPEPLRAFNDAGVLAAADVHVALRLIALSDADAGRAAGRPRRGRGDGEAPGAGAPGAAGGLRRDRKVAAAGEADGAGGAVGSLGDAAASVALAAALAVRGPRLGHVYVDLATIPERATVDLDEPVDLSTLPWPAIDGWTRALRASPLVAVGEDDAVPGRPLRLAGTRLYLDRYWREERQVAADLLRFAAQDATGVRDDVLADGLQRLFGGDADDRQRLAAATATLRRFAVVAGGPGTGKTTTVARILALLCEQAAAAGAPAPLVALAAPTGKAAARLEEAVHAEAAALAIGRPIREQLLALRGSTLHRLLGWRPGSHSRFRHDRANRLAHDVVVVDETSMVSLSLMARLVEAVRPGARLILVGDPGQLTSIEAGAVLGDIVGPAASGLRMRAPARRALEAAIGHWPADGQPPVAAARDTTRAAPPRPPGADLGGVEAGGSPGAGPGGVEAGGSPGAAIGDGIVVLDRSHRFGPGIAALAEAVRRGDADATLAALRRAPDEVTWIEADAAEDPDALDAVREGAVAAARAVVRAAAAGDAPTALRAIGAFRVLCAHRRGEHGAAVWRARVESWLAAAIEGFAAQGEWYVGRPLLVTENDYGLRLYNGDTGVVVAAGESRTGVAFERHEQLISPTRLDAVDTVYAMTIHKAQGSQFDTAAVLLAPATSPILTRELLYTAVTRARTRLIVAGTEDALRAAVGRPAARASGLRERLWGREPEP